MRFLANIKHLARKLFQSEDGNISMIFGLSVVAVLICTGSAIDYTTLSNARAKSQIVADGMALRAAIFVKNYDRLPNNSDEGYVDGQTYTAADLGQEFRGWVEGGKSNVLFTVAYDDNAKLAQVTARGATTPSFMQVVGKARLPFLTQSTASYMEMDEKFPASIALVLDNSGSMSWDDKMAEDDGSSPAGAYPRISGLRTSVNTFTRDLKRRLGSEDDAGRRTVRMGMLPYNDEIITSGERPMSWGYVQPVDVNAMVADGATNSNPPMNRAKDWMEGEQPFHDAEADTHSEDQKDALKFVIFMTDGQNTSGNYEVEPGPTGYWYGKIDGRWYYSREPYGDFIEGTLKLDSDRVTIESCQDMKDADVQIFTIGYALEVGDYNANNVDEPNQTKRVSEGMRSTAYSLLQSCASKPENFIKASDGEGLERAFDSIQNAIVEELIRIKS